MSSVGNQTGIKSSSSEEDFPIAAIVCLAVGAYVAIVIIILIIRYVLVKKGTCRSECCVCHEACTCNICIKLNDACPCCCKTNPDGCLSKICGQRKRTNCVDILLCNCCGCADGCCECPPCCDAASFCINTGKDCRAFFDCWDDEPETDTCACFCLAVKLRNPRRTGSIKRSTSAPNELYYSTHAGKGGHSPQELESSQREAGSVYTLPSAGSEGHSVQKRSKSHSPHQPHSDARQHNHSTFSKEVKNGGKLQRMRTRVSFDKNPEEDTLKDRTLSGHLSSSLSDVSTHDLSSSGGLLIKHNRDNSHHKTKSRARRSLRAGQRSQRYPNKILVTAESLNTIKSLKSSSDSENTLAEKLAASESRFLPQLTSLRSLPELRKSNT